MDIASIADKIACTGVNGANTGKLGCLSLFGTPAHFIALPNGMSITQFGLDSMKPEIQKGKMVPIIGAATFEDTSGEDGYSTNSAGVKRLNLKGLPEYRLIFEEGHEFYRQLAKMEGFKNYTFIIGDTEGNWMVVEKSNGTYTGFKAGHVTPQLTNRKVQGGDAERKGLLVQFLDRLEWDHNYAILHREQLNFIPDDIPLVNGVNILYNSIPVAGATTLDVAAVLAADNVTTVEGLVPTDFRVLVNGEPVAIAGSVEGEPGNYVLTIPALALADEVKVEFYDTDLSAHVIDSNDVLYRVVEGEIVAIAA